MIDLPLPSLGPDMESGKLLEWRIAPGQKIDKGTVIAVVDTAKAAIDVESWHAGEVIELLASPGDQIAVGTIIARLAGDAGTTGTATTQARTTTPLPAKAPMPPAAAPPRASPAARTAAASRGVDLAIVRGTGQQGVITLQDVERACSAPTPATATDRAVALRQAIGLAMARSKREIPHYYLWDDVDLTKALAWLRDVNASRPVAGRLLPAALLLAAVARAAREFEDMNGHFERGAFQPAVGVHLGVAIALRGGGLIAPALHDADTLPLADLMHQLADLVRRARSGGLRSSEISGQTLTVTHLGDEGSQGILGVIHPPQVALVGVGRIAPRAVVEQGAVVARDRVTLSLAADHRVSDGRRGAQFLARIGALLQQPERL
ncbi:MAG: 2-oxo acid dehydrogenase subunit E2 [Gammaproteobacteria bacterium]|nr:2-oxo acid dehydrogenase subunit E2 [Gammaproteobacteria bacterium]